jgi:hypothetical protein
MDSPDEMEHMAQFKRGLLLWGLGLLGLGFLLQIWGVTKG